jgi:hypothetical protein
LLRGGFAFILDDPFGAQFQQFARDHARRAAGLVHASSQLRERFPHDRGKLFGRQ